MPHHQAIRLHGVEIENRVEQRLPLFQAGGLRLQVHGVRAEARGGGPKADARARGSFEERQRHGLPAQRRQFFQRMLLNFLERLALVEKKAKFVRGERFEGQQIAEAVSQCPFSNVEPANSSKVSKSSPRGRPARRALPCRFRAGVPQ